MPAAGARSRAPGFFCPFEWGVAVPSSRGNAYKSSDILWAVQSLYSACAAASSSARTKPSTYASASASGQIGVAYCTVRQSCPCTVTAETEMHGADTV